jgi:hypothetical protein
MPETAWTLEGLMTAAAMSSRLGLPVTVEDIVSVVRQHFDCDSRLMFEDCDDGFFVSVEAAATELADDMRYWIRLGKARTDNCLIVADRVTKCMLEYWEASRFSWQLDHQFQRQVLVFKPCQLRVA